MFANFVEIQCHRRRDIRFEANIFTLKQSALSECERMYKTIFIVFLAFICIERTNILSFIKEAECILQERMRGVKIICLLCKDFNFVLMLYKYRTAK